MVDAWLLFCFVVLLGGSGFLLLLWEVMTNLNANGFLVKIYILKIILPSSKHFKNYFGLRNDKGHGRRKKHVFTMFLNPCLSLEHEQS